MEMLRIVFGPVGVSTSLSQTATPMPPWKGPILSSGGRPGPLAFLAFFAVADMEPHFLMVLKDRSQTSLTNVVAKAEMVTAAIGRRKRKSRGLWYSPAVGAIQSTC